MGKTNIKDKWKSLIEKHGKNKVYGGISAIVLVLLLCGFGITWAMTSSTNDLKKENQTVEVSTKKDTKEKENEEEKKDAESEDKEKEDTKDTSSSDKKDASKETVSTSKKESNANTSSSNTSSSSKGNSSNNSKPNGGGSSESKPSHTHSWQPQYKTVHHDAVYEQQWVVDVPYQSPKYEIHTVCYNCGLDFTAKGFDQSDVTAHNKAHTLNGEIYGYGTSSVLVSPEIPEQGHYENVLVSGAYDEQVLVGYKCSCGLTQN